jgi:hypothetical protein
MDTKGRRSLANSVSDGSSPETLHGVVSMMTATWLSLQGHFCPSFTPNREKSPLRVQKLHGSTCPLERGLIDIQAPQNQDAQDRYIAQT